jgi:hypothetical protein
VAHTEKPKRGKKITVSPGQNYAAEDSDRRRRDWTRRR